MSVRVCRIGRKTRDDDVRPKGADDTHDIRQDLLAVPDSQCLLWRFGEAKVERAGEELPAAIYVSGGEEFLGSDDAELFPKLPPEDVLSAIAARQREIRRAIVPSARKIGDELRVLVVRMGCDVEHAAHLTEIL